MASTTSRRDFLKTGLFSAGVLPCAGNFAVLGTRQGKHKGLCIVDLEVPYQVLVCQAPVVESASRQHRVTLLACVAVRAAASEAAGP